MPISGTRRFAKYGLLLCAQVVAALVFALLSRAESGRPSGTRDVPCVASPVPRQLTIVFVDSLSERVARDASVMPALNALSARGVSLEVSPCRDQLTYLCLRALLTGYDESSLLALSGNFEHAPSQSDNLLDRLAQAGRKVVAVGSHDFEPYQAALYRAKFRYGDERGEAELLADLTAIDGQRRADVTLVSLANGDRIAHAYGTGSPKYREAFRAIDRLIAEVVTRAGADSDILIFGDHGHDEMGRHLPGLPSTTVAVYAGPSFRRGVRMHALLSDHRAILGVLLGVATPPSYRGPEFHELFAPGVLSSEQLRQSSALRAPPEHRGTLPVRLLLACLTLSLALFIARKSLELIGVSPASRWLISLGAGAALALAGRYYDALRHRIHDHGSEPIRSFWLLVPLALGFALSFALRQPRFCLRGRLERGALCTVLLSFVLLFPTAYYYGASRATVLAAIVASFVVLGTRWGVSPARERITRVALTLLASGLLWSLYDLRGVGGETREMAFFVFSSPLFERYAIAMSCFCKLGLWLGFAYGSRRTTRDLSIAAVLLLVSLSLEHLPGQNAVLLVAVAGYLGLLLLPGSRLVATRFCLGLLALGQLYGQEALRVLPVQALLLCVGLVLELWRRSFTASDEARAAASGVTLAFSGYLLLWPTVGMRFSGIDFRFMFDWVPIARYEELWWVIALGMLLKFVWPYALLLDLARRMCPRHGLGWAYFALSAKLCALSVFAAWYATSHSLLMNGALEILAELALLLLVSALAWPSPLRAFRRLARPSAAPSEPAGVRSISRTTIA